MLMRCGECRTAVDESAEACPSCGAPRSKFRAAALGPGADAPAPGDAGAMVDSGPDVRRPLGPYARAGIGVAVVAVIFAGFAYYSKHSHLENVRRKCIATFELRHRCDCIVDEIGKNTYAISFVPMLRLVSGLSQYKLGDIIREASMACVEPR